jgi:hypothetical protein
MADTIWQQLRWDLFVLDKDDRPVLAVVVKAMPNAFQTAIEWLNRIESDIRSTGDPLIPHLMFVDLNFVMVFSFRAGARMADLTSQILTEKVLSAYEPEFSKKRIFGQYLATLVESWLRDFTSSGEAVHLFGLDTLIENGLAESLKGGTIYREVSIADLDSLRRNQLPHESLPGARLFD